MQFTYDALDRLLRAAKTTTEGYTQSYGYNPIGNIISTTLLGTYTYNPSGPNSVRPHAVISAGSNLYGYDLNGNMLTRVEVSGTQRITYTQSWDRENRLIVVTNTASVPNAVTRFVYDGDGARVLQIQISGTQVVTTAYASALEVQITSTQRITKTYYSAGTQLIAMRVITNGGNTLYFLHGDHLGSTSLTTDASGNVVARQLYDAWGNIRLRGDMKTDIGYTSQREDRSTNLMFYRARYYSALLGRFVSADTLVPRASDPQQLNRYAYARGNPIRYTDPTGHYIFEDEPITTWLRNPRTGYYDLQNTLLSPASAHRDYGINAAVRQAQTTWAGDVGTPGNIGPALELIGSIFFEPLDWLFSARDCLGGDCSGVLLGLLPFVPGSARKVFNVVDTGVDLTKATQKLTGQWHHLLSKKVTDALVDHETLRGIFNKEDLVTQAANKQSHNGYQAWHRAVDAEAVEWLQVNSQATQEQFLGFLQEVYNRPDMKERFPEAVDLLEQALENSK